MNTKTQQILNASMKQTQQTVVFGNDAHKELFEGATILAKAVGSTMGPSGKNVIIQMESGPPLITKDGVTVAKSINLKKKLPSMGAELLKEVASKTNEIAGDGTTGSTVLAYSMLEEGLKMIATGRNPIYLKKGMDMASAAVISYLKENCIPIRNSADIISVGTISANGDKQIGELLSKAIEMVGSDGIITIEPGKSTQTLLEVTEGMQFDGGYLSPYFITNSEKNTVELDNPFVLLTNRKISSISELLPLLEKVARSGRPLLIIADEVEGEALHTLIVNKLNNVIAAACVKAPSYGENRTDILGDMATILGGSVLDISSGTKLEKMELDDLGVAKKVVITRTSTTIIGESTEEKMKATNERVESLKSLLANDSLLDELHVDRYKKRLAKLAGGVAVIKVGGSTEVEILEKKDRVEDALNATIAAAQEGIVPGGGTALFYAQKAVQKALNAIPMSDDERAGTKVIFNACQKPLETIVSNTGKSADVVKEKLSNKPKKESNNWGYDASTGEYLDLVEKGIIDPVKVARYALEHASSVVGLMLTCDAVVVNESE